MQRVQSVQFIVNPISGGKDKGKVLSAIERHLDPALFSYHISVTTKQGEATSLASQSQADIVVAVGGDGTVSEVARGLLGRNKTFGVIPCGSGDGLALHLGISRNPVKAVQMLSTCHPVPMDVGWMNGEPFFCTVGLGLDARVSLDFSHSAKRGLPRYISLAWHEWLRSKSDTFVISSDGKELWAGEAVFVVAANINQWGNQARIAPMASVTDGLLDIIAVPRFSAVEIPDLATRLMLGKAQTSRRFIHFSGTSFQIIRKNSGAVQYDGDPREGGTAFNLSVSPGELSVLVPNSKVAI